MEGKKKRGKALSFSTPGRKLLWSDRIDASFRKNSVFLSPSLHTHLVAKAAEKREVSDRRRVSAGCVCSEFLEKEGAIPSTKL